MYPVRVLTMTAHPGKGRRTARCKRSSNAARSPQSWRCISALGLVLAAILLLTRCSPNKPPTGNVDGTIDFQGEPVGEGNVVFQNPAKGWLRTAPLNATGEFRLPDVPVGEYVITVQPLDPVLPNENTVTENTSRIRITPSMIPDPKNIPRVYRSTQTSPLTTQVVQGENKFTADLSAATP